MCWKERIGLGDRCRPAQNWSAPPPVRTGRALQIAGTPPVLSKAAATVRVDFTRTASLLDSGSQTQSIASEGPCLVRPASHATTAKLIVNIQLSDYRVNNHYYIIALEPLRFSHWLEIAMKKARGKGRKEENGPPTLDLPFASNPFASCLRTLAFLLGPAGPYFTSRMELYSP